MKRAARLGAGEAIERVFREGVAIRGPFFVWRSVPNTLGHTRWAFAVGKRTAPHAVVRNAVRRRLRAAADAANIDLSCDIVLIARARGLDAPVAELFRQIQHCAARELVRGST